MIFREYSPYNINKNMSVQQKRRPFFCVYYDMGKQVWEPFGRGKEAKQQAEARDLEVKLRKERHLV